MRFVSSFPQSWQETEHLRIPTRSGVHLAARAWIPDSARLAPVPAVVEVNPYRKRDGTRWRDEPMHRYFAGHGYAALRLDVRGTGESEGLLSDEYSREEHDDTLDALDWLRRQTWCDGRVGMIGKSWGAFHALQVAARAPQAVQAVIAVCASDDRYAMDAHYMGGCLLNENFVWGSALLTLAAHPPDPELVGSAWRARWHERIEALRLFPAHWLEHPTRDAYWRYGSVGEELAAIRAPVYAVSGWADAYAGAVLRLVAGLEVAAKGLIGPWAHVYPHNGSPGPAIGFLQEAVRWWDEWLRGRRTGLRDEPRLRVWMQDGRRAGTIDSLRPGRWIAEPRWPSSRIDPRTYFLAAGTLAARPRRSAPLDIASPQSVGRTAPSWCGFALEGTLAGEQRPDDARSLVFDSAPLEAPLEILGTPTLSLRLASDRPLALLAARLCDVAPDGSSTRVTYGLLNLTAHDPGLDPRPLVPGRPIEVAVELNAAAHSFASGHRLRLALSNAYWPVAWPSPVPGRLRLETGDARLVLPVRPVRPDDAALVDFPPPTAARGPLERPLDPGSFEAFWTQAADGAVELSTALDAGGPEGLAWTRHEEIGLDSAHAMFERFTVGDQDPSRVSTSLVHVVGARRPGWELRITTEMAVTATTDALRIEARLAAHERGRPRLTRRWSRRFPRALF